MRTKTLLLTAALSVATAATSMADVFSVNAVGYINLTLNPGFNMIANQLNSTNNNSLNSVLPSVPADSLVYTFNNGVYTVDVFDGSQWLDNDTAAPSTTQLTPGKGFFFNNPASTNITVTLVGEVPQGTNSVALPPAFSLVSVVVPQQLPLVASNAFPAVADMLYYSFKTNTYTVLVYDGAQWLNNDTAVPETPNPAVGEGFFINNPGAATNWTRAFSVNN
jgi:hypothetical protein